MKQRHIQTAAAFLLLAVAVAYRLCTGLAGSHSQWLPNFSPIAAIALCGAIFLTKRLALLVPLAALFLSDLVLNSHYGVSLFGVDMLSRYVALGLIVALGWALRGRPHSATVLLAAAGGSTLFYLITNTGSWLASSLYAKTLSGWVQALTTGLPGYPPTWVFFRNSLASDLLFTALFLVCMAATRQQPELRVPRAQRLEPSIP